jgi:DNA-binding NarL/FixJ family response regulator
MLAVLLFSSKASSMHKCRLLLVDDYVPIRAALRALLAHYHGVRIVGEANDGQQALNLMALCQPHVILMDINMPRMNGIEATALIKTSWKEAIVIGLYAVENPQETDAMMNAGAAAVISKHHIVDLYPTIQKACLNSPFPLTA